MKTDEKALDEMRQQVINDAGIPFFLRKKEAKIELEDQKYFRFTPELKPLNEMLSLTHLDLDEIETRLNE